MRLLREFSINSVTRLREEVGVAPSKPLNTDIGYVGAGYVNRFTIKMSDYASELYSQS